MENRRTSPELSNNHYLHDAIEADTARKEYSEWISQSAKELIDEHGSFGTVNIAGQEEVSKHFATKFNRDWNLGAYLLDTNRFGRSEGVRLNLVEHNDADEVTRVITLAKINLPRQKVSDMKGNDLSIEELRNISTTLERLLEIAKQG